MRFPSCFKTILSASFVLITGLCSYAQKTEIKLNAYSGLFFYRGNGSSSSTTVFSNDTFSYGVSTPFGRKSSFSYTFEMQVQRVTRKHLLYGAGIGWEELKSLTYIDSSKGGDLPLPRAAIPVKGKVNIASSSLTLFPYIGQRFATGKWNIDALAGVDLSVCTKLQETAHYFYPVQSQYTSHHKAYRSKYFGDIRPRIQINTVYGQFGVTAGYSLGLLNLYRANGVANYKAYSNFLRLGISYKLK